MLDVFNNDAFSSVSLTASINRLPYTPGRLGAMNLFSIQRITTTTAVIEEASGRLEIIPSAARGTHNRVLGREDRKARPFLVPHFPLDAGVSADDAMGIRQFGTETQVQILSTIINDKLTRLRNNHEITHEHKRVGAIQGIVYDYDGTSVLTNYFTEFGLVESTVSFNFTAGAQDMQDKASEVIGKIEDKLGAIPYSYVHALVGATFFNKLRKHATVVDRMREQDPDFGTGPVRETFEFGGIIWEKYRGKIGSVDFIPPTVARFFPVGVPDLFQEVYAPADTFDAVGRPGEQVYVYQELRKFGKGLDMHSQSNMLALVSRPEVLIKGTDDTP